MTGDAPHKQYFEAPLYHVLMQEIEHSELQKRLTEEEEGGYYDGRIALANELLGLLWRQEI